MSHEELLKLHHHVIEEKKPEMAPSEAKSGAEEKKPKKWKFQLNLLEFFASL